MRSPKNERKANCVGGDNDKTANNGTPGDFGKMRPELGLIDASEDETGVV